MNTIVVWLLVVYTGGAGGSVAPANFASKADCMDTAKQMPMQTRCVSAIVIGKHQ